MPLKSIPAHGRAFVFRTAIGGGLAVGVREYGYTVSGVAKYLRRDQANVSTMLSRLSARETERN